MYRRHSYSDAREGKLYRSNKRGIVTDRGDMDQELLRRAIERWRAGKGGPRTQARLKAGGFKDWNKNPRGVREAVGRNQPSRKSGQPPRYM